MMLLSQQLLGVLLITLAHGVLEVGADGSQTTPDVTSETITVSGTTVVTDGPQPTPEVTSKPLNQTESWTTVVTDGPQPTLEVTSEPLNITESQLEVVTGGPQPTPEVTSEPLNITEYDDCPVTFSQPKVVVEYGEPVLVNCFTNITHESLSWEGFETEWEMKYGWGSLTLNKTTDWEIQPSCAIIYNETQCSKNLSLTIYKTPDSVSISRVDNKMIEGFQYDLQCDIVNVAPVKSLIVKWFKGETEVQTETFNGTIKTPVNETSTLQITAVRDDDGVQYRCEAELELGAHGPQPPPKVTSELLNITVYSLSSSLQLIPPSVVVEYGSSVSVNCSADVTHDGMGWNASDGSVPETREKLITWRVSNLRQWDIRPKCYINYKSEKHETELPVTVYKTPDSVSISTVNNKIIAGSQYELQCDIVNVAPVESLIVKWFKGETEVHTETFNDTIKTPVNKTSTLEIFANRSDDGAQYRCETELNLGINGPQPPLNVTSEPLNITISSLSSSLQLIPPSVVVEYGSSVSVNCSTDVTHDGIGWNASDGSVPETRDKLITWRVSNLRQWDIRPKCYINYKSETHETELPVKVYKTPNSVSISPANWLMIEGSRYKLQCNIVNVAPVESLIVKWFKGETRLRTDTFNDTIKTPENKTPTFMITANRDEDGAQYRCEAELELGIDGPQPPPKVTSKPLNITVYSFCDFLLFNPSSVVVEYGSSVSVNCSTDVTHDKIGWDAQVGSVSLTTDKLITWNVSNLRRWDIRPKCYIRTNLTKCVSLPPVLIYKTPDSVSISTVDNKMIEGFQYELQCYIVNVAPVKSLIVKWFKGDTEVKTETFTDTIKTPVNKTSKLKITVDRDDDGAQYRCEAELNLGIDGPQPPPKMTSEPLNISVYSFCDFLQSNPPSVVVEYGSSVSVNCSTDVTHDGMGWEAPVGNVTMITDNLITWKVSNLRRWDIRPICYISTSWTKCVSLPSVLIYKTPDSVSINRVDYKMIEGFQYELQCDIVNVAPVKSLTVKWFKGETEVYSETFTDNKKTPVNKTSKLKITVDKDDDGAQYRCEAELNLGIDGPQPPPKVTSKPLRITVNALLEFNPPSVVVEYDSSVSVDCITYVTHDGIGWEAPVASVPMTTTDKLITWRVSNLRQWDIRPQCYMNYNRDQISRLLPVTIYKTPDSISINTVDHTGPMTEGSRYELQCDIVNVAPRNLTVKWFKGETEVYSETFTDTIKTPVNETSKLNITAVRDDDGAQYRCEAELELGADGPQPPPKVTSEPLNITIHYKPQISVCNDWTPKTGTLLSSHPSSLYSIVGNPRPNISWKLGSSSINDNNVLNKSDSGRYTITARNTYGESSCEINITVEYPPTLHCSETFYQIKEKEPFKFPCSADGLPKSVVSVYKADGKVIQFPFTPHRDDSGLYNVTASNKHGHAYHHLNLSIQYKPQISVCNDWTPKTGTLLSSHPSSLYSIVGNPRPNISWKLGSSSINDDNVLYKSDSGRYTITARNTYGESSCEINITVEYPPTLNCSKTFYEIKEKEPFKFPCSADGLPKSVVSVYKADGKVIQFPFTPHRDDSGLYNATASNKHGHAYHHLNLSIQYAPVFDTNEEKFDVDESSNITLKCIFSGNPEPDMWWTFKNQNISTGGRDNTINITKATSVDAGVYTCSATNQFGRKDKHFTVVIKEKSPSYFYVVYIILLILAILLMGLLFLWLWKKSKARGSYQVRAEHELIPLTNGKSK
ncbi:basement membrane-specific heparan sulfate proteoglycan core protein isoform X3 [Paramisgurnus dabryanus]|uniref:basement membrane-specific heparan sulfate proteoglycan core protein isoform X3 n=1 Tax=Paramisgurnus dabryanus TaxID=90735 RepID=UPI0031F42FC8